MSSFISRVGKSELTFTDEGELVLFEATFEARTSSFFRLIEASGNTLSPALMSGLLVELLTFKNGTDQQQNLMAQAGFESFNPLLLMAVTDQLQNLMIETGFQKLNYLLLMVTQTGLDFHSLVYIC